MQAREPEGARRRWLPFRRPSSSCRARLLCLPFAGGAASAAFVCSTDMPLLHPAFVRRVVAGLDDAVDVAMPLAGGPPQTPAPTHPNAAGGPRPPRAGHRGRGGGRRAPLPAAAAGLRGAGSTPRCGANTATRTSGANQAT